MGPVTARFRLGSGDAVMLPVFDVDRRRGAVTGSAGSVPLRDRAIGLLRSAKGPLVRVGAGSAFQSMPVRMARRVVFRTRPSDVVAIIESIEATGVRCWVAGGWGIDALLGRQTRRHNDLDLCIDVADDGEARAAAALEHLGYRVTSERADSGPLFPVRAVYRDSSGRTIDLLLVATAQGGGDVDGGVPVLEPDSLSTGRISERSVGCLSPAVQLRAHMGYVPQMRDRVDVERLCSQLAIERPAPYRQPSSSEVPTIRRRLAALLGVAAQLGVPSRAATALVVPVPAAQVVVSACGGVGPGDLPAHVTVLFPFVPVGRVDRHLEGSLATLFASTPAFSFRLARISSFPGTVYLEPEPAHDFVGLTQAVTRRWPSFPPYEGAFDAVIPHVTLGHGVGPADLEPTVAPHLPIDATATEVVLMARDRLGSWAPRSRFPLAGATEQ